MLNLTCFLSRLLVPAILLAAVILMFGVGDAAAQIVFASPGIDLLAAAATVPVTLRTPHWDRNKKLYRPGSHDLPIELAREWGYADAPTADALGGPGSTDPAAGPQGGPAGTGTSTALPEDFPGREHLVAANLTTREAVAAKSDEELDNLPGVGPATVREIREALK